MTSMTSMITRKFVMLVIVSSTRLMKKDKFGNTLKLSITFVVSGIAVKAARVLCYPKVKMSMS